MDEKLLYTPTSNTMTDRLGELKRGAAQSIDISDNSSTPRAKGTKDDASMQLFLADVELIKKQILSIIQASAKISDLIQQVGLTTSAEHERELYSALGPIIRDTIKKVTLSQSQ